jgi:hypothetical protein
MKQKYAIVRDDKNKQLIVREFAELDKEILSLLCEAPTSEFELPFEKAERSLSRLSERKISIRPEFMQKK